MSNGITFVIVRALTSWNTRVAPAVTGRAVKFLGPSLTLHTSSNTSRSNSTVCLVVPGRSALAVRHGWWNFYPGARSDTELQTVGLHLKAYAKAQWAIPFP